MINSSLTKSISRHTCLKFSFQSFSLGPFFIETRFNSDKACSEADNEDGNCDCEGDLPVGKGSCSLRLTKEWRVRGFHEDENCEEEYSYETEC